MSNATPPSRESGDSRRRNSRGGKNRNRNNQNNQRDPRGSQSKRSEEFRPSGPRPPRGSRPVKLSWWQKLLKAVGLYKAPAPQPRRKREEDNTESPRPPKSNTRNARSQGQEPCQGAGPSHDESQKPKKRSPRKNDRPRGGDPSTVESPRVYVGNLSYDVSEQDLQELFKGVGPVRGVEVVYNRSTHRSKGYGFVEMLHQDDAVRCVEVFNDQPFMGRNMIVSGAKSKGQDEREDLEDRNDKPAAKVVLAPLPEPSSEPETAASSDVSAEPVIETIVETPTENAPSAQEVADDLVAKYGFEEEENKSSQTS